MNFVDECGVPSSLARKVEESGSVGTYCVQHLVCVHKLESLTGRVRYFTQCTHVECKQDAFQ